MYFFAKPSFPHADIFLVRHTTVALEKPTCYGFSDIDLHQSFEQEKQDVWNRLSPFMTDYHHINMYSSPLQRCKKLANFIHQQLEHQSPIIEEHRLKEMNFGDWEMKEWHEIDRQQSEEWTNDFVNIRVPNGENYRDVYERSVAFWQEMSERHLPQESQRNVVIVVAHAGTIRCLLAYCLHIPLQKANLLTMRYGSLSRVRIYDTHSKVEFINS
jgi:alpha-ribazole phosphatase